MTQTTVAPQRRSSQWLSVPSSPWADVRLLQLSFSGLLVIDVALQGAGGILRADNTRVWTALLITVGATLLVLAAPAVDITPALNGRAATLVLVCTIDLAAIGIARLAPNDGGVAMFAVLPAVWLSAGLGRAGVVYAGAAAAVLITLPGLVYGGLAGEFLSSSVPVPIMVVVVGLAVSEGLERAAAARVRAEESRAELELALATLQTETQRVRAILETADIGLILVDPDGSTVYANPPARAALQLAFPDGDTPDVPIADTDALGSQVFDEDGSDLSTGFKRPSVRIANGEEFTDVRIWVGPPGARRLLLVSGRQLAADGPGRGGVIAFNDITERARARRLRSSLLNAVAHELRTPLMSLDGYLSLLGDVPDLPTEALELLPALTRSSARLRRLGAQLIHNSEANEWSVKVALEQVQLTELLERTCTGHATSHPSGDVPTVRQLEQNVTARVDPILIARMLEVLLTNAHENAPRGTPVTVGLARDGEGVEISVRDLGRGIDSSKHLAIFEPTREMLADEGTLSGLPFCRAVAVAHGGHLDVDSQLGAGSTFVVVLPDND